MENKDIKYISFTSKDSVVLQQLSRWMLIFISFYIGIGVIYFLLAANVFYPFIKDIGIDQKLLFGTIVFVIGFIAILLARQLYGANKNLKLIISSDNPDEAVLGRIFGKLKNFFFTGAIFLIAFIILIVTGFIFVFLNEL